MEGTPMQTLQRRNLETKSNLPVEEIKSMLDQGMRQVDVATFFNVSQPTISRLARMAQAPAKKEKEPAQLCTSCGRHPIAKGNRFLCSDCYRHQIHEDYMAWA